MVKLLKSLSPTFKKIATLFYITISFESYMMLMRLKNREKKITSNKVRATKHIFALDPVK